MNCRRPLTICLVQINYNSDSIQNHLARIKDIIQAHRDADLIVFPELILHGHPSYEKPEGFLYRKLKAHYGPVSEDLYCFVREVGARVIIGELKRRGEKYYNLATYIDRNTVQSYAKTHVHWTENFAPGRELKVFETPMGKVGVNICFDSAFSEVWRDLALQEAEIVVNISAVPSNFPAEFMWRRLQGAALFNQIYVVYANRPGGWFSGYSAVFDPRGRPLVNAGTGEAIIETEINLAEVPDWRAEEAIFPHRRPLLYRRLTRRHPFEPGISTAEVVQIHPADPPEPAPLVSAQKRRMA